MKKNTLSATLLTILFAAVGRGQDAHFSQMLHAGSLVSPALTGSFEQPAEYRAAVQYRQQWASLAPAYRDFMASLEKSGRVWQVGGVLYGHDAGAGKYFCHGAACRNQRAFPGERALDRAVERRAHLHFFQQDSKTTAPTSQPTKKVQNNLDWQMPEK